MRRRGLGVLFALLVTVVVGTAVPGHAATTTHYTGLARLTYTGDQQSGGWTFHVYDGGSVGTPVVFSHVHVEYYIVDCFAACYGQGTWSVTLNSGAIVSGVLGTETGDVCDPFLIVCPGEHLAMHLQVTGGTQGFATATGGGEFDAVINYPVRAVPGTMDGQLTLTVTH